MSIKQIVYIVDDFTSNSVELYDNLYGNITFFDYAGLQNEMHWDFNSDGVVDRYEVVSDYGVAYRPVNYDITSEWSSAIDNDYSTGWTYGYNAGTGLWGYYKESYTNYGLNSSNDSEIRHGDWVLSAFYDQLENPSDVEVILVDIDTEPQRIALFSNTTSLYSVTSIPTFEYITEIYFNQLADVGTAYIPSVFSYSYAPLQTTPPNESSTINSLIANNILVVQSAPNVQNGDYSWGQTHPSVINVGAWNVNSSNEFLGGSTPVLDSIDIYANGLVEHFGWDSGSNFGTSFATPRVSAEIVNHLQGNIEILNQLNYSQLLASVDLIASDVYVEVNGVWQLNPLLIMSDDISSGLAPALHSSGLGIAGMVVTNAAFVPPNNLPTGSVSISGTARQGQVLTASNTLADVDGLGTISYQWRSNGNDISSATDSTYTLTQTEVGTAITVVASYNDLFGNAESVASDATASVANVNDAATGAVSISGTARQGQLLTALHTLADVDGLGTIAYQWRSNGTNISGAIGSTYTLTQAEVGKVITVVASYADQLGSAESVASGATASVANVNDAATGAVSISGTARQGQLLTALHTLADVDGLGTIAYQWRSNGTNISGAIGSTYTLTQAEVGKVITVVASYADQLGSAESVASSASQSVAAVLSATYTVPVSSIDSIGLSPDGQYLLIKVAGVTQSVPVGSSLSFNGNTVTTSDLTNSITVQPVFQSSGGSNGYALPEVFTGPASLNLDYQLIENAYNAVVIGGDTNDFIKVASSTSTGKAVNGGGGDDVIDGGVGSTFISGGSGSNTFFLDGRAPGVSWSTVTDFKFGQDKATIWGWKAGVSSVLALDAAGGAAGYTGLTLHFKNLLPDGAAQTDTNSNLNSITFTRMTLQDFGVSSLEELNTQLTNQSNIHFLISSVSDAYGEHGYLFLS